MTSDDMNKNERRAIGKPAIPRGHVRDACLAEALRIIEELGVEALSFREVSRRLGVSYQAPYKHFESKDSIIAELLTRCFDEFASHLEAGPLSGNAAQDMYALGENYFDYARRFPTKYRLMFETPMPEPEKHPAMMAQARRAFTLLKVRLAAMTVLPIAPTGQSSANLDALFVWSVVHGLASILNADTIKTLNFSEWELHQAAAHCLARIGVGLGGNAALAGNPPG
ncbi:TetR/AcrR family transcriptional regulator [Tardiphaga sp. vice352]|nr:TetR/AcrR family transcriptional regulator [Tardiphaga sp. vice278]QDM20441.1 TetR/AcrR family transcriptional regulator [Tardiphaga sp. vice154]QDM25527.1 TetR/AcrR family transcriptional regulator [Tardiphaga sp. vice304]QDM30736.1 TetR/AcrR family transcriptional regulator [Tardiphaga sp. vice352]